MCRKDFYYYKQKIVIKIVTATATATLACTAIYKVTVWSYKYNCKSHSHKNNIKQISLLQWIYLLVIEINKDIYMYKRRKKGELKKC